jgi:allantoate deiminase
MLFLRCAEGISHHPAESVREEDVAAALKAGLMFLDEVAQRPRG